MEMEKNSVTVYQKDGTKPVTVHLVETSNNPLGVVLVDPERTNKCSDPTDLVELARQVQNAEGFVRARAHGRLEIIAEQIKHLQAQAKRVLEEARRDDVLHHAACNVKKVPGTVLPLEWGPSCPHQHLGAYRLEADMSWTPEEQLHSRTNNINFVDSILNAHKTMFPLMDGPIKDQSLTCDTELKQN